MRELDRLRRRFLWVKRACVLWCVVLAALVVWNWRAGNTTIVAMLLAVLVSLLVVVIRDVLDS